MLVIGHEAFSLGLISRHIVIWSESLSKYLTDSSTYGILSFSRNKLETC